MRSTTGGVVFVDDTSVVSAIDGCSVRGLPSPLTPEGLERESAGAAWVTLLFEGEIPRSGYLRKLQSVFEGPTTRAIQGVRVGRLETSAEGPRMLQAVRAWRPGTLRGVSSGLLPRLSLSGGPTLALSGPWLEYDRIREASAWGRAERAQAFGKPDEAIKIWSASEVTSREERSYSLLRAGNATMRAQGAVDAAANMYLASTFASARNLEARIGLGEWFALRGLTDDAVAMFAMAETSVGSTPSLPFPLGATQWLPACRAAVALGRVDPPLARSFAERALKACPPPLVVRRLFEVVAAAGPHPVFEDCR